MLKKSLIILGLLLFSILSFSAPKADITPYPLDGLPTPEVAYGLRGLSSAYNGKYVATSGGAVSAWLDQSGHVRSLQQAVGSKKPSLSGVALSFDGADDFLSAQNGFPANQLTLVAAVAIVNNNQDNPIVNLLYPYGSTEVAAQLRGLGTLGGNLIFGFVYGGQQVENAPPSTTALVSWLADETTGIYTLRLNGVEVDAAQQNGTWYDNGSLNGIYVGKIINGSEYYGGLLYELYGWSVVLTDPQLEGLEENIMEYLGISQ